MKLALAPFGVSPPSSFKAFLLRIERLAAEAALAGADLLALPEYAAMVCAGAEIKAPDIEAELIYAVDKSSEILTALVEIAKRHKLYILGGSLPMRDSDGKIRNRAPFIAPSGQLEFQDKQAMTRFEEEEWGIAGGAVPKVFETKFGRIGISICYDSEFPLHVRPQVAAGAKLILVPCCTASPAGFNRVRFSARARAVENQCYTAVIPLIGEADWSGSIDVNVGHAALFTPCDVGFPDDGVAVAGALNEPKLVFAKVDFESIDGVRQNGAVLNHRDWSTVPPSPIVPLA
ncbi:carbon-nitrogen hydrolase family protein [Acidocella aminolytica]|jgi:predicted amidohydrolase|uniref:Carbon-nitrogen hydrolase n=1 Tax=Acidocella aminolytica 101 = DSM 11237 TaxID=1120923 RepID=A0A0D6PJY4_9PROT|nr:carbon-nitrogen hydrolase family protein [Acidocella aminolytica]GAN81711.1 carbon-nitrogen hydrolase [Acidocella aminolytica 101 = DSM 11237]GBQ32820.1 putative amidohydrolase [Acidocella aminolytica 101 = DSM 11237]SHE51834.1 Predicted amidohydrolase [Acidocella aminolytica 101 = DSM 11237]